MADFRKRGRNWYFKFTDADGCRVERKGCPDRRMTEQMAAAMEAEAGRIRSGLSDAKTEARRRHAGRPLRDHLAEWHAHLIAKGGTAKHADLMLDRARRVAAVVRGASVGEIDPPKSARKADRERIAKHVEVMIGPARLADLTRDRVQAALATLRDAGRSLQTCNHHRTAIRGFARWAWKDGRTIDDALGGVAGFNAKEDRRHDRRTLGVDELRRLIAAAHGGPTYQKMSGPARALCYRLAVATGLRYSEIRSITPEAFDLSPERPTVTVAAAYTKNGEPATLPLPADLAADLARS